MTSAAAGVREGLALRASVSRVGALRSTALQPVWMWAAFIALVMIILALDLGVFHRRAHVVTLREAGAWTVVWVALAALFGLGVNHYLGGEAALQYFSSYLIEKALSVDNIFVFVLLFSHFAVPPRLQHRVLFWGILGAMVMRGVMIVAGTALITAFHWIVYPFGLFLIWTGVRMLSGREQPVAPSTHPVFRLFRKLMPIAPDYRGARFLTREWVQGRVRWVATPLLVVLVLVEATDLLFAVDSIPAAFAITRDPFLIFTANIFAILGLRSLYFLLAGVLPKARYLKAGLSVLLVVIGVKMLTTEIWRTPVALSLGVIALILGISVVASIVHARRASASAG